MTQILCTFWSISLIVANCGCSKWHDFISIEVPNWLLVEFFLANLGFHVFWKLSNLWSKIRKILDFETSQKSTKACFGTYEDEIRTKGLSITISSQKKFKIRWSKNRIYEANGRFCIIVNCKLRMSRSRHFWH